MNLNHIINEIEKVDGDVKGRLDSRRSALKNFASFTGKAALATLPIAFGSMFKKAYAGTKGTQDVFDVLNYALTLEYLEAEFYSTSLMSPSLLTGDIAMSIQTISKHETAHVNFLKEAITAAGGTPVDKPTFDFSGGKGTGDGPFKDAFSNLALFLAVAQTFEDTGVRAYKGRAAEIVGGEGVLTAALQIHSVEARHAAHIRYLRQQLGSGFGNLQPWITGNMSGIDSELVQPSYNGEENTMQAMVEITNINGFDISSESASEAFDEPLTPEAVLAIVDIFIV
ncbi:MAG: ferritin-like domain-containing protein [Chitinophagaceae bacterium]|nr:MAG: ferritin-like domain-containing protein [Chitinophagaceae bacterium]